MTDAINTHCPWSGDAVSAEALTVYREQTVGFCNSGCRDKFEQATLEFDQTIALADPYPKGKATVIGPYVPRHFTSRGLWEVGDMRLKLTLIAEASIDQHFDETIETARIFTEQILPGARAKEGEDHHAGFVILHQGNVGTWLLVHWWAHADIQLAFLAMRPPGGDQFYLQGERHFHACVWEQVVISHERDAWVEQVMKTGGDIEAYLEASLKDGWY
ncbi:MAG: hypothetical protein AAGA69_11295 [Pseudomonadota bacterium]